MSLSHNSTSKTECCVIILKGKVPHCMLYMCYRRLAHSVAEYMHRRLPDQEAFSKILPNNTICQLDKN